MKRFAVFLASSVMVTGLAASPARAVVVTSCGGSTFVFGGSCHVNFASDGFGYFMNLNPDPDFTGRLTAQVTSGSSGFSVSGFFVFGQLAFGSNSLLHDLAPAGTWKLTVTASPGSSGDWNGSIEAGPF